MDLTAKTAIIGLGLTGQSCIAHIIKKNTNLVLFDTRNKLPDLDSISEKYPTLPISLGELPEDLYRCEKIIVSPGVPLDLPALAKAREAGVPIIGDIELFMQSVDKPVLVITGTNGKSTVTDLLGTMLKRSAMNVAVGGNIGTPALDLLQQNADIYVLELSSFQLESTFNLHFHAACILNVSPDHLDRHKSFEDYLRAKHRVYKQCKYAVANREDSNTWCDTDVHPAIISYGFIPPTTPFDYGIKNDCLYVGSTKLCSIKELALQGEHHYLNAMAAFALAQTVDADREACIAALKIYKGLAHRCELILNQDSIAWINDSKATNVGATLCAIRSNSKQYNRLILLLGGDAKGQSFAELAEAIAGINVKVIVYGVDRGELMASLKAAADISEVVTLDEAAKLAKENAEAGDAVLLSPACASFDQFDNFIARGNYFRSWVMTMKTTKA